MIRKAWLWIWNKAIGHGYRGDKANRRVRVKIDGPTGVMVEFAGRRNDLDWLLGQLTPNKDTSRTYFHPSDIFQRREAGE